MDAAVRVVRDFATRTDADLLLFPECFLQGYLVTEEHVRAAAAELASPGFGAVLARLADLRPMIVLGVIERAGDRFHNTAVVIKHGQVLGRYRKTFLTAGESIFTAGDDYPVFDCHGVRFGINICYDTQFREAAAAVAAGGARLLLVPAQNMLRRDSARHWEHRHHPIRARRARETGLWLISADVTGERPPDRLALGPTSVIDPAGRLVAHVPTGTTGLVTADLTPGPGTAGR
ncbi:hypothetical protein Apa02nite_060650 [Actinoplanes palleronii]|uniref:CN hydrolase domain-containing protein n=1 Tax=Actinoplanes palleronii TaxID=113570 RepID=A0ABQ4BH74_9ACTN|nr:hypothetical protein Apa02nite_060650 [Actinoplanes palleronii]